MRRRPRNRLRDQHSRRRPQRRRPAAAAAAGPRHQRELAPALARHGAPVFLLFEQRLDVGHFPAPRERRGGLTDPLAEVAQDPRGFRARATAPVGAVAARPTRPLAEPDDRRVELVGGQVAARGAVDVGDGARGGAGERVCG